MARSKTALFDEDLREALDEAVQPSETSQKGNEKQVKTLIIQKDCRGEAGDSTTAYYHEVIRYVGATVDSVVTKYYFPFPLADTVKPNANPRKQKKIPVVMIRFGEIGFKNVAEFFAYMVKERGYHYVEQR